MLRLGCCIGVKRDHMSFYFCSEIMGTGAKQKDASKATPSGHKERPNKSDKRKNSFKASHAKRLEDAIAWMYHWHTDRSTWTFDKKQQTLLVQAWMDSERMPKDTFAVFCLLPREVRRKPSSAACCRRQKSCSLATETTRKTKISGGKQRGQSN